MEELQAKLQVGLLDATANQTLEQLSIFQNKEMAHFRGTNLFSENQDKRQDNVLFNQMQKTIENLNSKLTKLKSELLSVKEDNMRLKVSNENQIYINEKLNKALTKFISEKKNKKADKRANEHDQVESVISGVAPLTARLAKLEEDEILGTTGGSQLKSETKQVKKTEENEEFGGDISSIMINPMEENALQTNPFEDLMEESVAFNKF